MKKIFLTISAILFFFANCDKYHGFKQGVYRLTDVPLAESLYDAAGFTRDSYRYPYYGDICFEIDFIQRKIRAGIYDDSMKDKTAILNIPLKEDGTYDYFETKKGGKVYLYIRPYDKKDKDLYLLFSTRRERLNLDGIRDEGWPFTDESDRNQKLFQSTIFYPFRLQHYHPIQETFENCVNTHLEESYIEAKQKYEEYLKEQIRTGKAYTEAEDKMYNERKKYADQHGLKMNGNGEIIYPKE
ncbi:hypothetical protein [Leptospira biflexa]|uniref:hypothetical protein n=1 Tax=Leptospira biflexa TaxID=172 RepID=UPI00108328E2|nr:hypothetical protein [Leptospira biflexa]TGM35751.1 hypothetical protein EHQ89_09470 [Leptospira biflexa]TGM37121.1 hypothetical protein EHQ80_05850 [Leptospira biflexa]